MSDEILISDPSSVVEHLGDLLSRGSLRRIFLIDTENVDFIGNAAAAGARLSGFTHGNSQYQTYNINFGESFQNSDGSIPSLSKEICPETSFCWFFLGPQPDESLFFRFYLVPPLYSLVRAGRVAFSAAPQPDPTLSHGSRADAADKVLAQALYSLESVFRNLRHYDGSNLQNGNTSRNKDLNLILLTGDRKGPMDKAVVDLTARDSTSSGVKVHRKHVSLFKKLF